MKAWRQSRFQDVVALNEDRDHPKLETTIYIIKYALFEWNNFFLIIIIPLLACESYRRWNKEYNLFRLQQQSSFNRASQIHEYSVLLL